jgi:GT2 family glycosyltransferase
MKNGIVILNYNDWENTSLMLDDIKNYQVLDYIIVVDNKSTDDSIEKLKKYENNKIKIVEASENKGYAAGNNVGIKYLIDNYDVDNIIISNPDIIVREEDIAALIKDLERKDIALIAPVIKEPNGISRGWHLPTFASELVSNIPYFHYLENKMLAYKEEDYKNNLTEVEVVKGCFFIIKKDVFEAINFFDENTFLYYEEIIMGKKLRELGFKTYVDNRVTIIHALSKSVDKSINRINKFKILKSSQYYYEKYINELDSFKLVLLKITYYINLFISKLINIFRK